MHGRGNFFTEYGMAKKHVLGEFVHVTCTVMHARPPLYNLGHSMLATMHTYMHIYIYVYICMYVCMYVSLGHLSAPPLRRSNSIIGTRNNLCNKQLIHHACSQPCIHACTHSTHTTVHNNSAQPCLNQLEPCKLERNVSMIYFDRRASTCGTSTLSAPHPAQSCSKQWVISNDS